MRSDAAARRGPLARRLGLAGWTALVTAGSLLPLPVPTRPAAAIPGADKVAHAGAYAVLCLLVLWNTRGLSRRRRYALAAASAAAFGLLMECLQPLTGRTFALGDLAADALGIALALLGHAAAAHLSSRTTHPE